MKYISVIDGSEYRGEFPEQIELAETVSEEPAHQSRAVLYKRGEEGYNKGLERWMWHRCYLPDRESDKGGEGSGHHDHTGLPGVWGGSRPTGRAEPDKEPEGEHPRDSALAASDIRDAAERNEPAITKIVTGVVEEYNGEMYQLDCRLKEVSSIQRRLDWMMDEDGRDLGGAIEHLTDSVRYTMVLDDNIYVDGAKAAIKTLEDQGWAEYKDYFENYWECGFGFEGYITVFSKGDQIFELQFHTPSAIKILAKSHAIYERSRTMKAGPAKDKLTAEMEALWATVPSPPGWETLRGKLIGRET